MNDLTLALQHFQRGIIHFANGDYRSAEICLLEASRLAPNRPSVLANLSAVYTKTGRHSEAVGFANAAVKADPKNARCWHQLGAAQLGLKQIKEALSSLDAAIRLDETVVEAHVNKGYCLNELGRHTEAITCLERAIRIDPKNSDAHTNMGVALNATKRYSEAIGHFDESIKNNPANAFAHNNRGLALAELKRFEEALMSYEKAIHLEPSIADFHCNRADALKEVARFDEALVSYDRAISLTPSHAKALYNKGFLLLSLGKLREGFKLYAARRELGDATASTLTTSLPRWDGSTRTGRILIWAEQGIGDEVFYSSMLPLITGRTVDLTVSADKRLHAVYLRSFPGIKLIDRNTQEQLDLRNYDAQTSLVNLPAALRMELHELTAQRRVPFFKPDITQKEAIAANGGFLRGAPVCGISWRSANKAFGTKKSVKLADLAPLISSPDITFVNLQYGEVAGEIEEVRQKLGASIHLVDGLDPFNDIDGLLALIDNCDIVFTTSNVTAHLAGSIGKKAVVLVPSGEARIWYWFGESQSRWYPSIKLVHQGSSLDWRKPIEVATALIKEGLCLNA